ncbi:uncharacterized protein AB675_11800 [Cyphellophora attinorum]|uniref:Uncharacterized protein n=1 Tax=Cyphellophora attinorum TaxID=1664694 RepID=A0A0N0NJE3_9EURO|nr:uncharacterized protein AB675_11800 [Phialophora attinorum]KPI36881.1 hypothetical protein AB675_11800 [Phialophora attinorum]
MPRSRSDSMDGVVFFAGRFSGLRLDDNQQEYHHCRPNHTPSTSSYTSRGTYSSRASNYSACAGPDAIDRNRTSIVVQAVLPPPYREPQHTSTHITLDVPAGMSVTYRRQTFTADQTIVVTNNSRRTVSGREERRRAVATPPPPPPQTIICQHRLSLHDSQSRRGSPRNQDSAKKQKYVRRVSVLKSVI